MQSSLLSSHETAAMSAITTIDLDAKNAKQWINTLTKQQALSGLQLVVDCATLKCLRTMGVSHVISQLLVLHKSGTTVWLRNVDPLLHRCLHLLRLHSMFHIL